MLKNILLALSATLLTLLCAEGAMRVVVAVFHRQPIVVSDAQTGWSGRPNLRDLKVTVAAGSFSSSTDRFGRRIVTSADTGAELPVKPALVIVGDSFAYGLNVSDSDAFAWRMAHNITDRRVINLGVVGWGTDQELIDLESFFRSRGSQHVQDIVVLVYENDLRDVQRRLEPFLGYHKPRFQLKNGVIDRGDFHRSFFERLMDHSRLAWAIRIKTTTLEETSKIQSDPGEEMVLACLNSIQRLGEAQGARVHIFAHRRAHRQSLVSPAVWRDFLARSGAVDITDAILAGTGPEPVGYDGGHWSAEGHRRAADAILASL